MEETYVSCETAKLAKDKGFIQSVYNQKLLGFTPTHPEYINEETNGIVSAPTQSLLCKWLREKYNINVCSTWGNHLEYVVWYYEISKIGIQSATTSVIKSNTYEEALELGLQECLKNLT